MTAACPFGGFRHGGDRKPSLYINGQFIKDGLQSSRTVRPSARFFSSGGPETVWNYGTYLGWTDDIKIYNRSLSQEEIQHSMYSALADGLIGFWIENSITNANNIDFMTISFGADYTLPISNGILITSEHMLSSIQSDHFSINNINLISS